jgi:hypothetical protein
MFSSESSSTRCRALPCIIVSFLMTFLPSVSALFLKKSTGSGALATGMSYHSATKEYMIAGIGYDFPFWGLSSTANQQSKQQDQQPNQPQDSYCAIVIDDPNNNTIDSVMDSYLLQRPQVCMGGVLAVPGAGVRALHVMGTTFSASNSNDADTEPIDTILQPVLYNQAQRTVHDTSDPVVLPQYTYPVTGTTGYGVSVYVALHEVHNGQEKFADKLLYHAPSFSKKEKLQELLAFRRRLLDPRHIQSRPIRTADRSPRTPQIMHIVDPLDLSQTQGNFQIALKTEQDTGAATIAAMTFSKDKNWLIVGGSVHGTGSVFGTTTLGNEDDDEVQGDAKSWDGFVTFFHGDTGEVIDNDYQTRPFRIRTTDTQDDFVHDICHDDSDGDGLYVVGTFQEDTSKGKNGGAFVQKYSLNNRKLVWTQQIPGGDSLQGLRCEISPPNEGGPGQSNSTALIYVGGENQEDLNDGSHLATKDVFVRAFTADSGYLVWSKELDTSKVYNENRHDELVRLEVNPDDGDIVVALVNSMNFATGTNDIVFFDLTKQSGSNLLDDHQETDSSFVEDDPMEETPIDLLDDNSNPDIGAVIMVACIVPLVLLLMIGGCLWWTSRERSSQSDKLNCSGNTIMTLNDPEVEEAREEEFLDEQQSPPVDSFKFFENQTTAADPPGEPEWQETFMDGESEPTRLVEVRLV